MTRAGRRIAAVAAAGAVALLLSGCGSPEPEPQKLTLSEAGTHYLSAVCPVNGAWDRADVELDRLRLVLARGPASAGKAEVAPFSEAIGEVGAASTRAAEELGTTAIVWPKAAAPTIDAVRDSLAADAAQAKRVAKLDAAAAIAYRWDPGDAAASDTRARAALGLTGEPQAACAQWRAEQQKKPKSKSSEPVPSTGAPKEQQ
ncbi:MULTISPECIES: hypothetical protein [unclassified Leucobacter]|uniref:hypothetical protein n=1 Tax=unclassified Leucobacter TaxID=2621730 RepID=UPI00062290E2|nr:hypothetical protein [Leucobacter sp. Ag1]KKI22437.1 hypothetical protein XM48_01665 [Leucobacter sp. Ag1]